MDSHLNDDLEEVAGRSKTRSAGSDIDPIRVFDPAEHVNFDQPERSLEANERLIRDGLATFVEVGSALMDIRASGQYREAGFDSFDDYCRDRWGLGKDWAHAQISASRVYRAISVDDRQRLPENVEQTKPLARLLPRGEDAVREAWQEILEAHDGDEAITGREIRAYLNLSANVPPSQRPVSDAYLSVLDKVRKTLGSVRWAVNKAQGEPVPVPVAERYAKYAPEVRALATAFEQVANGETPTLEEVA